MKVLRITCLTLAFLVASVPGAGTAQASGTVFGGGVINEDTTWSLAGSPYTLTGTVQIAEGVTLRVEAGVTVLAEDIETMFKVAGHLDIDGTPDNMVTIDAGGQADLAEPASGSYPETIRIEHATISNGIALLGPPGGGQLNATLDLLNSTIIDMTGGNWINSPHSDMWIAGNVFRNSAGFLISQGMVPSLGTGVVHVEDNFFQTATRVTEGGGQVWVFNFYAAGVPTQVHRNTFAAAGTPSVALSEYNRPVGLDATGNYWGTTDAAVIAQMITDSSTNVSIGGRIPINPILTAPSSTAPKATPLAPLSLNATPSSSAVAVSWLPPVNDGGSPITGYSATADPGGNTCTTTGDLSCDITGLDNGTRYTITVTASNTAGTSPASDPVTVIPVTSLSPPGAVQALQATPGRRMITVTWKAPTDLGGATAVTYQYRVGKGGWISTSSTNVPLPGKKGKRITVTVRALNDAGPGPSSRTSAVPR